MRETEAFDGRGLLFRRARFVSGPPVPAGGTVKDQHMPKLILDEGNRALAHGEQTRPVCFGVSVVRGGPS